MSTVQLREEGTLYIPDPAREKYAMEDGDEFTLVDLGDGDFYLSRRTSSVSALIDKMVRMREEAGLSVEDILAGLAEERENIMRERYPFLFEDSDE